jgi:alpha-D-ribose 1-methylphosphonate 5-triphosphate diphosphatase PhnM
MLTRTVIAMGSLVAGQGFLIAIDAPTALAGDCDIAIINGRVMDPETNFDAARNVCVKDRKIARITEGNVSGKETIDASGHVVAPGFIDTHHHGAGNLWGVKASLRDGVTTPLDLDVIVPAEPLVDDGTGLVGACKSLSIQHLASLKPAFRKTVETSLPDAR